MIWRHLRDESFGEELREFTKAEVAPKAAAIDEADVYPTEIVTASALRGYNSLTLPKAHGGAQLPVAAALQGIEEISYGSAAVGISLITIFQAQTIINLYGEDSLKAAWLPRFGQGLRSAYALTEKNRGSDITSLETRAEPTPDGWRLRGEKAFITSGSDAELFIVLAQAPGGVLAFAVPRDTDGVSTYIDEGATTFGLRNGPHVTLSLSDTVVPRDHLIGIEGAGVKQAVTTLSYSRTLAAGISLGIARAAIDGALDFANDRTVGGHQVIDFQGIQWYFADAVTEIDAARLLAYSAADDLDAGRDIARSTSEAKLLAGRTATRAAEIAIQVCGARGTRSAAPFGRYLRDAKAYEIAGGSNEVLKNTIAKQLQRARA